MDLFEIASERCEKLAQQNNENDNMLGNMALETLTLYEATGCTSLYEAYGSSDYVHTNTHEDRAIEGYINCGIISGNMDHEKDDDTESEDCEESEDEINHEPLTAKDVLNHNKNFGRTTRDLWLINEGKVYGNDFVAVLRPLTKYEFLAETKEDIHELKKHLANMTELNNAMEDLDKMLSRFEVKINHSISVDDAVNMDDPNLKQFPLPHDFFPTDLRKWICNWEPFDFQVTPWPSIEISSEERELKENVPYTRTWLDTWQPFDMEITGECAWSCLQVDAIANDILTEKQKRIEKCRKLRKYLGDTGRMKQRRRQLTKYFESKYLAKSKSHIGDHIEHFISNLDEAAKELDELCMI